MDDPLAAMSHSARFRRFSGAFEDLLAQAPKEPDILREGARLLAGLVAIDDWLPDAFAAPDVGRYRQYLLHCDPLERFCVVSFVWGPGQATPVHNHTVWGLIGVLRGAEVTQSYEIVDDRVIPAGRARRMAPGEVAAVSPTIGDLHRVENAFSDRVSVSIHVYGGNIGRIRRTAYEHDAPQPFVSGYSNDRPPSPAIDAGAFR